MASWTTPVNDLLPGNAIESHGAAFAVLGVTHTDHGVFDGVPYLDAIIAGVAVGQGVLLSGTFMCDVAERLYMRSQFELGGCRRAAGVDLCAPHAAAELQSQWRRSRAVPSSIPPVSSGDTTR
jgi:hypothetical protein